MNADEVAAVTITVSWKLEELAMANPLKIPPWALPGSASNICKGQVSSDWTSQS